VLRERASQVTKSLWEQGHNEKCVQFLVSSLQGKRPIGRPRRAWEDNIKVDNQEVILWILTGFTWFRTVYSEHYNESSTKCRKLLDELSYYQMLNAVDFLKLGCQTSTFPRVCHLSWVFGCLLFFKVFECFDGTKI